MPGIVRTGATFTDAAAEYLRYAEHDRGCKPSTLRGYRSMIEAHLLPAFGSVPVEDLTTDDIEAWIATIDRSVRTRNKLLIVLHGLLERARKVYGLARNAATDVEKFQARSSGDTDIYTRPRRSWPSCGRLRAIRTRRSTRPQSTLPATPSASARAMPTEH
ncbi:MAG TPA: N-terminal phage integrase SAM-like domain-containing protein [Solirubrobacteraceae bacterium]|nr:N-terminal phage integrase SAM-like domain-containing protein [Solirubrobacteraceae bacterium]